MPERDRIWELPEVGNVEISEDNRCLVFRLEIKVAEGGESNLYTFITTLDRKNPSTTLNNVEKGARHAGMVKGGEDLQKFMTTFVKGNA